MHRYIFSPGDRGAGAGRRSLCQTDIPVPIAGNDDQVDERENKLIP